MRVTHIVARYRAFSTYVTSFCHVLTPILKRANIDGHVPVSKQNSIFSGERVLRGNQAGQKTTRGSFRILSIRGYIVGKDREYLSIAHQ